ncbi:MAG: hypothetical protein LQ344_001576 [Seirophora lacunosa]|nr:MAG: hypothetical protein LQ344_001576 [Seirophora lacunosa]
MTRFRPCIDLHSGQVKQIVGGTLSNTSTNLKTNYVSEQPASYFASIYKEHALHGAHVIMLGPGNEEAAQEALEAWPGGLQIGGGITADNAKLWVERGAEKVIVTSYLFPEVRFSPDRLEAVLEALDNNTEKLVIDLSCRKKDGKWIVAMNKWQTPTDIEVNQETIRLLEPRCSEFLIHAADNEGLQRGIDEELVVRLGQWCTRPVTYAGGGRHLEDLDLSKLLNDDPQYISSYFDTHPRPPSIRNYTGSSEKNSHQAFPVSLPLLLLAAIMKPVVSALNAWSCIVVSVFAIVILSVIGGLFKSNQHSMVGSTEDPPNGPAVAGSVFAAVIVYAVRLPSLALFGPGSEHKHTREQSERAG